MVEDGDSPEDREVGAEVEHPFDVGGIVELAGDTDGNDSALGVGAAGEVSGDLTQRATGPRRILRSLFGFLETVPEGEAIPALEGALTR